VPVSVARAWASSRWVLEEVRKREYVSERKEGWSGGKDEQEIRRIRNRPKEHSSRPQEPRNVLQHPPSLRLRLEGVVHAELEGDAVEGIGVEVGRVEDFGDGGLRGGRSE